MSEEQKRALAWHMYHWIVGRLQDDSFSFIREISSEQHIQFLTPLGHLMQINVACYLGRWRIHLNLIHATSREFIETRSYDRWQLDLTILEEYVQRCMNS